MTITLFGYEIGFWPVLILPLAVLLLLAAGGVPGGAIRKTWSGKGGASLSSRLRILLPRTMYFAATVAMVLALADIARLYAVVMAEYAFNRLYVTLDNSSSMYNFTYGPAPIRCTDEKLKYDFSRIHDACKAVYRILARAEAYAKDKGDQRKDQIGLLRFAQSSFVGTYGTTDYDRARTWLNDMNWRDPRTGITTEVHLAMWDMWMVALARHIRHAGGMTPLDESDMKLIREALQSEGPSDGSRARFRWPSALKEKLPGLRKDLRDTAFILITDALPTQFASRLNASNTFSLVKQFQMAAELEVPIHVISIAFDHETVRKLAERTGFGPLGSTERGAFHLLKSARDYEDVDRVVDRILDGRFRVVNNPIEWRRETYTVILAGLAAVFAALGFLLGESSFGRSITKD